MEEIYWNRFLETGKIEDYLYYKGIEICAEIMEKREREETCESDRSNRRVLSQTAIGENDRRVVILSKERGKIAAFARGARRPNSALVGATNPFSFGTFTVYEGRTSYTLVSASISNYFEELRTDIEGAYYGFYFLDLANYYAREANDETMMLKLLYQTLRALTNPRLPDRLIRYIYELKCSVSTVKVLRFLNVSVAGKEKKCCIQCKEGRARLRKMYESYNGRNSLASIHAVYIAVYCIFSGREAL